MARRNCIIAFRHFMGWMVEPNGIRWSATKGPHSICSDSLAGLRELIRERERQ